MHFKDTKKMVNNVFSLQVTVCLGVSSKAFVQGCSRKMHRKEPVLEFPI